MKETGKPYSQQTSEEFFDQFAAACGYDCCEEHRAEARKVFLSGFTAAMHFMTSVSREIGEPQAVRERIKVMHEELKIFALEMLAKMLERQSHAKLPVASDSAQPGHN